MNVGISAPLRTPHAPLNIPSLTCRYSGKNLRYYTRQRTRFFHCSITTCHILGYPLYIYACDRHVTIYALTTMHACLNACCIYYSILIFISIMMLKHFTLCTKISTGIIYPLVPRFLQALSKS